MVEQTVQTVRFAAVPGTTPRATCGRPTATGTTRMTGTTILVSGAPELTGRTAFPLTRSSTMAAFVRQCRMQPKQIGGRCAGSAGGYPAKAHRLAARSVGGVG